VSDAGAGFDPDGIGPTPRGTGFGLLSVRERLGFLGGKVEIRSNPGLGTSVVMTVPLQPDRPAVPALPAPARAEQPLAVLPTRTLTRPPTRPPTVPKPTAKPLPKPKPKPKAKQKQKSDPETKA
jgi:outer membrane biosynthesis protein TonB